MNEANAIFFTKHLKIWLVIPFNIAIYVSYCMISVWIAKQTKLTESYKREKRIYITNTITHNLLTSYYGTERMRSWTRRDAVNELSI